MASKQPYKHLILEKYNKDKILVVKFNRPENLNAMNRDMMDEIVNVTEQFENIPGAQVIVITGAGSSFMAGADIKEYASASKSEFLTFQRQGMRIYRAIEECSKPILAAVHGYALGGGMEIALACDLLLVSESAQLGLPEIHLGLVPGGGGTQRLIQKIGINRTKEILFTGDRYSSRKLFDWGIVNKVFSDDQFFPEALAFAEKLTRRSTAALAQLKHLARLSLGGSDISPRMNFEGHACYQLFCGDEAKQKIETFVKKSES